MEDFDGEHPSYGFGASTRLNKGKLLVHRTLIAAFLTSWPTLALMALERLDLAELDVSERAAVIACKKHHFSSEPCKRQLDRVCTMGQNAKLWTCLERKFRVCTADGRVHSPSCHTAIKEVCDKSQDQYDFLCSDYRYERCKERHFEGDLEEWEGRRISCKLVRQHYTLIHIRKELPSLSLQTQWDYYTKHLEPEAKRIKINELLYDYEQFGCRQIGGDRSHPDYERLCTKDNSLHIGWGMFVDAMTAIDWGDWEGVLSPEGDRRVLTTKRELLQAVLPGRPVSVFEQIEATSIWLDHYQEMEVDEDWQSLRLLTRLLAEWGDDSVVATFALLQAARMPDPGVLEQAISGLASRHYDSGLVVARLIRSLKHPSMMVRRNALIGLGRRWHLQLQSAQFDRRAPKKLQELLSCISTPASTGIYAHIDSIEDLEGLPLDDPKVLCNIGVGARLRQLRNELYQVFEQTVGCGISTGRGSGGRRRTHRDRIDQRFPGRSGCDHDHRPYGVCGSLRVAD